MMKIAFKQNGICVGYGSQDSKEMIEHIADQSLVVVDFPENLEVTSFVNYFLENGNVVYLPGSNYSDWWILPTQELSSFIAVPITGTISSTDPPDEKKWFKVSGMPYNDISNNLNQIDIETYKKNKIRDQKIKQRDYTVGYFIRNAVEFLVKNYKGTVTQKDINNFNKVVAEYEQSMAGYVPFNDSIKNATTVAEVDSAIDDFKKGNAEKNFSKRVDKEDYSA